jgi:hypothetical protein
MNVKILTTFSRKYYNETAQYTVKYWHNFIPNLWKLILHDCPQVGLKYHKLIMSKKKHKWIKEAFLISQEYVNKFPLTPLGVYAWLTFCHKAFALWETYEDDPKGILIWCDSDVLWKKKLDDKLILKALDNKFCGYFGADLLIPGKVETGIIFFDLNHPIAKDFFFIYKNNYLSFDIFKKDLWYDNVNFTYTKSFFDPLVFNDIAKDVQPTRGPIYKSYFKDYCEHWMGKINKSARKFVKTFVENDEALIKNPNLILVKNKKL